MASASLSGFSMTGWNATSFRPQLPLPPVTYPNCFGKGLTLRYFMQSKILALAFLILGISFVAAFACAFLPFWMTMDFNILDSTFGAEGLRQLTKDMGIFFFTKDQYANVLFLEKSTNRVAVPWTFKIAQVTEIISLCALFCSFGGSGILAFKKYGSLTGSLFLAALSTLAALGQVAMIVLSFITVGLSQNAVCERNVMGCRYKENLIWRNLPINDQRYRISQHTTPLCQPNWALYIAAIGAALSVVGCILMWIESAKVCKTVNGIRYRQLREKRDVHENERSPTDFIISPQPRGRPPPMRNAPPSYGYNPEPNYQRGPPMYRGPGSAPSVSEMSSQSGSAFVSREIDL